MTDDPSVADDQAIAGDQNARDLAATADPSPPAMALSTDQFAHLQIVARSQHFEAVDLGLLSDAELGYLEGLEVRETPEPGRVTAAQGAGEAVDEIDVLSANARRAHYELERRGTGSVNSPKRGMTRSQARVMFLWGMLVGCATTALITVITYTLTDSQSPKPEPAPAPVTIFGVTTSSAPR